MYTRKCFWVYSGKRLISQVLFLSIVLTTAGIWTKTASAQFWGYSEYDSYYGKKKRRRTYKKKRRISRTPSKPIETWKVDENIKGPVQIVVSLSKQHVSIFKGGKLVTKSSVSTGKAGHSTPTGLFSILQKHRRHYSNLYSGAPMPHMQRITWSGLALHGGYVPRYPASHGCIRLPYNFARKLFGFTRVGAQVIIARDGIEATPSLFSHTKLFQPVPEPPVPGPEVIKDTSDRADAGTNANDYSQMPSMPSFMLEPGKRVAMLTTIKPAVAQVQPIALDLTSIGKAPAAVKKVLTAEERRALARAKKPVRILVTRRTGREQLLDAQDMLKFLGYYKGDIDGYIGKETIKAIKKIQYDFFLEGRAEITDELVAKLYKISGRGEVRTGHIYVRQGFQPIFDTPLTIAKPKKRLGTHVYTAMYSDPGATQTNWTVQTIKERLKDTKRLRNKKYAKKQKSEAAAVVTIETSSAREALDRLTIPQEIRERIARMLTPGSSMVISDNGLGRETGKGTDFVVLTR